VLHLELAIAPDSRARVRGAIRIDGDAPRQLVTGRRGAPATATCANADDDGMAGLVKMSSVLRDVRTGERIPVVLETLPGLDIDSSGTYGVILLIGEERMTSEARVLLRPGRRKRKRRHRQRKRRHHR
jgi:hypothetical protein